MVPSAGELGEGGRQCNPCLRVRETERRRAGRVRAAPSIPIKKETASPAPWGWTVSLCNGASLEWWEETIPTDFPFFRGLVNVGMTPRCLLSPEQVQDSCGPADQEVIIPEVLPCV